jgi:anti-sigma factor RsiW
MPDDTTLWRFVDGELPPAEAEAVERAAAEDPALQARIDDMRALKRAVLAGAPAPSPGFPENVARLAETARHSALDLEEARRFLKRLALAAAVLAAVGLFAAAVRVLPKVQRPVEAAHPVDALLGR